MKEIQTQLEAQGVPTTIMPLYPHGSRLVIASRRTESGLHGNSFWITNAHGPWHLVTWGLHWYLIPDHVDPVTLCMRCIGSARTPINEVSQEFRHEFGLVEIQEPPEAL